VAVEGFGLLQQALQVAAFDHGFDVFPGMGVFVHGGFSLGGCLLGVSQIP
jgi:hypothetical protein